jgi:CBS domain-containing protein
MTIGKVCKRKVAVTRRKTTALEAARLMRRRHVGNLVVVDEYDKELIPVGIITDRDLVVEVMAADLDAKTLLVEDVMSRTLIVAKENASVNEVIRLMRRRGIRRVPVISNTGALVGITVLDDLLALLAGEMHTLARVMPHERSTEARLRP